MGISRTKLGLALLAGSTLVAGHRVWAQQLPAECRTPVLTDACQKLMGERAGAQAGALSAG